MTTMTMIQALRSAMDVLLERDPGEIESFGQLQALMQWHRQQVQGVSRDAKFLRWLMDREWNRLATGSGYRNRSEPYG